MARKSRKNFKALETPTNHADVSDIYPTNIRMPTAAYGRLSVENGGRETDDSLQNQMAILYKFIEEHPELELVGSYMDNGHTGTNFDRPEFQRLMDDARTGRIQCIVIKDLSRFGRDYLETGYYLETILPHLNVRVISVNDHYDSFRKEDKDILSVPVMNIVNDMYAKDLSKKICASSELRRKKKDVVPFGKAPYGYVISDDRKRYEEDPEAAVVVRAIFQWRRMGVSCEHIAKRMNLMEIPVPLDYSILKKDGESKGRKWTYSTVKTIIRNPSYTGDTCMGRLRQALYKGEGSRKTPKEEWTILEDTHVPLVSKPDQQDVENITDKNSFYPERFKDYNIRAREPFRDQMEALVYCKECGCRMNYVLYRNDYSVATQEELDKGLRGKKNGVGRVEYYVCPPLAGKAQCGGHRISIDFLKILVMDQIRFQITLMAEKKKVLEQVKTRDGGKNPILSTTIKLRSAKSKLALEEERLTGIYENYAEGLIEPDDYRKLRKDYAIARDAAAESCRKLEIKLGKQQALEKRLTDTLTDLESADAGNGFNEELVKSAVEKITISATGDVEIRFRFHDIVSEVMALEKEGEDS